MHFNRMLDASCGLTHTRHITVGPQNIRRASYGMLGRQHAGCTAAASCAEKSWEHSTCLQTKQQAMDAILMPPRARDAMNVLCVQC